MSDHQLPTLSCLANTDHTTPTFQQLNMLEAISTLDLNLVKNHVASLELNNLLQLERRIKTLYDVVHSRRLLSESKNSFTPQKEDELEKIVRIVKQTKQEEDENVESVTTYVIANGNFSAELELSVTESEGRSEMEGEYSLTWDEKTLWELQVGGDNIEMKVEEGRWEEDFTSFLQQQLGLQTLASTNEFLVRLTRIIYTLAQSESGVSICMGQLPQLVSSICNKSTKKKKRMN
eukprot:TRINITY_DN8916_c0_g1_i1.p1 TRINITY_DN8916_c0_g1~~TRINITY_DN8916_c0_g1_i1.p1  ORF type:complete len:249 (-),score=60.67 TRINITY_DN8916_c0_g1_i1:262-963(-)